jgi:GDP-4-dehydro-6-deoxy-D-mannose reductase
VRVLITGYGGFAGGHLAAELLAETDWRIWGTLREEAAASDDAMQGRVQTITLDLRDAAATREAIESLAPDLIFHLAGQTNVPRSWEDPWATMETNLRTQLNLLQAMRATQAKTRLISVASNEVYGASLADFIPTDETAPLAPMNPYASSKAAQDLVALQYHLSDNMDVLRMRPFNHVGPGQSDAFVVPSFARQIAEIEAGLRPPELHVGNLDAERDFSDVRDIVRAYRLAAQHGRAGAVYNLGSGISRPIHSIVEGLRSRSTLNVTVKQDPARMRPSDIPRSCCDAGLARRELGWEALRSFDSTLDDVLAEWRDKVRTETS